MLLKPKALMMRYVLKVLLIVPSEALQYILWISNSKLAWTLNSPGMAADTRVEISARPIPQEPMVCPLNATSTEIHE